MKCPVCGEDHGEPIAYGGMTLWGCPMVPEDMFVPLDALTSGKGLSSVGSPPAPCGDGNAKADVSLEG